MYKAYITKVTNIRPAENADRLNLCEIFGNTTVVDKSVNENDLYLYLPVDGQISEEFGQKNDLFRRKDENGNPAGGFIEPDKRNIKAIKLRGNRSDGLILPLSSLNYCFAHGDAAREFSCGDVIDGVVNGHEICCKYVPRSNRRGGIGYGSGKMKVHKVNIAPLFAEHADTEQLSYNLSAFKPNDLVEISLKLHGTSARTGYLPVLKGYRDSWACKVANTFKTIMNKLDKGDRQLKHDGEPVYEYDYVSGTRRTILENYEGGFYGDNSFRKKHHDFFVDKLEKGETVYMEIVGFTDNGTPIMPSAKNDKVGKDFVKQYGKETHFTYGCEVGASDIYVYRMTLTNEDGFVVEYTPEFMRYRCEQMGVKCVPVLWKGVIPKNEAELGYVHDHDECPINAGEWIKNIAERFYDGPDPIGKTHVREGVVCRILNRPKFAAYKHKNWSFRVLSGIAVAQAEESGALDGISDDVLAEM